MDTWVIAPFDYFFLIKGIFFIFLPISIFGLVWEARLVFSIVLSLFDGYNSLSIEKQVTEK